jgi:acetoin utilization deacetylase AcuC-like enzyme
MSEKTGYIFDERFLGHDTGNYELRMPNGELLEPEPHPSNARITRRTAQLIAGSGIVDHLTVLDAREATTDEIRAHHDRAYVDAVQETARAGGGWLDKETPISSGSWQASLLAAGSAMALVDAMMAGQIRNAYGLLRPPGHHAMPAQGMGFCVFNNVVFAARHARQRHGVEHVMVVDWDVHHGNGTQAAFWNDPATLFVSIHQDDWYPAGWGEIEQTGGAGAGGRTVNVPLPPGCGNHAYLMALERIVVPIARQFQPDVLFISAGQDPSMMDPLGQMMVTMDGFRSMATMLREVADDVCDGRLIALQEGGYSAMYTPFCTLAVIEGIAGQHTSIEDPYLGDSELAAAEREFRPHQETAIDQAREIQRRWWRL